MVSVRATTMALAPLMHIETFKLTMPCGGEGVKREKRTFARQDFVVWRGHQRDPGRQGAGPPRENSLLPACTRSLALDAEEGPFLLGRTSAGTSPRQERRGTILPPPHAGSFDSRLCPSHQPGPEVRLLLFFTTPHRFDHLLTSHSLFIETHRSKNPQGCRPSWQSKVSSRAGARTHAQQDILALLRTVAGANCLHLWACLPTSLTLQS